MPSMTTKRLTIGQVAQKAGIGVETVRFYEREGLVAEPPRSDSGYRDYPPDTVARLLFIRRAKELGFTLKEIKELLSLRPTRSRSGIRALAQAKIADIDAKIELLKQIKQALGRLVSECPSGAECPILQALEEQRPAKGNT